MIPQDKTARESGYETNKGVKFKRITGIYIENFRSLKNREVKLGQYLTLITGKNGTMKSSLLGLIAHPFSSPNSARDLYGKDLKTDMRDVFKMSLEKDTGKYIYYLNAITTDDTMIAEPVRMYPRPKEGRHRITVSKENKAGLGNFSLNTSYINLKRLFPIIDTDAKEIPDNLTEREHAWISSAYNNIMQRNAYSDFETISDKEDKNTCAPKNSYYDYNSISSGEDNLGFILYKMLAFVRNKSDNVTALQGIFCIDEIEASLHPVAQERLFDFLYSWAKKHHIQIVATTHSLYLVNHCLEKQSKYIDSPDKCVLINISTMQVGRDNNYNIMINPDYKTIYRELTYKDVGEAEPCKVNILCEDTVAKIVISKILKTRTIITKVNFITDISGGTGTSCKSLITLVKNGQKLLSDSIVIVDPDVNIEKIHYKFILKIPDLDDFPIEKRIAQYINTLDGADDLFAKKEQAAHQADMADCHINFAYIKTNPDISPYKDWATSHKIFFRKALTHYIHNNLDFFADFRSEVINMINSRRSQNGLQPLEK